MPVAPSRARSGSVDLDLRRASLADERPIITVVTIPGEPAIDVCALERRFGRRTALAGVDLAVRPGEIHALLGPNGAGKATVVGTLAGLVEPTGGAVRVLSIDASDGPRRLRGRVGFVPSSDRS